MRQFFFMGIRFLDGSFEEIQSELCRGGLMVVPSAPGLATLRQDKDYHNALCSSRFAIFDSGFFCLLLLFKGFRVKKFSGLAYLRSFLDGVSQLKPDSLFLIDPTTADSNANRQLLMSRGYSLDPAHQYIAPMYATNAVYDELLVTRLLTARPKYILINLGGGIQEKLGAYLNAHLDYAPCIICTGAAIAFLTGRQVSIPPIIDLLYLGWLARCFSDCKRFIPRYICALKLLPLLIEEKFIED